MALARAAQMARRWEEEVGNEQFSIKRTCLESDATTQNSDYLSHADSPENDPENFGVR